MVKRNPVVKLQLPKRACFITQSEATVVHVLMQQVTATVKDVQDIVQEADRLNL